MNKMNKLKIDYCNKLIHKPKGLNSHKAVISFNQLKDYFNKFRESVDINTPENLIKLWKSNKFDYHKICCILDSIIVTFGGGYRIWGRFKDYYDTNAKEINEYFKQSYLNRNNGYACIKKKLSKIKGLGGISYSTKVMRFLNPDYVVMDTVIMQEYGLEETDYNDFVTICRKIAKQINIRPADVESALYAYAQINNPNQRLCVWRNIN